MKPPTALEDATLRFVLAHAGETNGWLDLTRISSRTARMLPDVRRAVARLQRRGQLQIDESAANTERWIRFLVTGLESEPNATPPRTPAP